MASLPDQLPVQTTPSNSPDLEPDGRWKKELRHRIEGELASMAKKIKDDQIMGASLDGSSVQENYDKAMNDLRKMAEDLYQFGLEKERQARRLFAGQTIDKQWEEVIVKEQQEILNTIEKGGPTQSRNSVAEGAIRNEELVAVPARATQRDNTTTPQSVVRERARKQSSYSDVSPEDPRLRFPLESRSSFEDRESGMIGHLSRRRNEERVRDTVSIESPPKSQPEIWVPAGASNVTSRTLAHAVGTFSAKPRRDSSVSIGTANSIPATIPEHSQSPKSGLSWKPDREFTRGDGEHDWSGIARSRQKVRKPSGGSEDRIPVSQFASESRRLDEYPATSPSTSVSDSLSPSDVSKYQTPITTSRPAMSQRRSSIEEGRQGPAPTNPRHWYPPPQVSEPKPINNKKSFRDEDAGYFHPSSGRWETRGSPSEGRLYDSVSLSPDDLPQPRRPPSLTSRSSLNSLRYRNATMVSPQPEVYPEDIESDFEEYIQQIKLEFSQRESHTKKMEEEVTRKREEALKKEKELTRKEEEARRKETEARIKEESAQKREEEAQRREEELRHKEEQLKHKEEKARKKEEDAKKKEEEAKKREAEAKKKEEENQKKEEEIRRKNEEFTQKEAEATKKEEAKKEEDAKRRADEAKRKEELEYSQQQREVKRKEDDSRRRELETKQKEHDMRLKEEAMGRKELEAQQKEEEIKRKEEEARQKEEEIKRKEEEARQKEKEIRRREEEARQKEEEIRRKEEEARQKEEEIKRKEAEALQKEEEAQRKAEEAHKKEADTRRREREIRRKEDLLRKREDNLRRQEAEARSKDDQRREEEEEEVKRRRQSSVSSETVSLYPSMKEEEMRQKEEELAKKEADLQRREAELRVKEEEEDSRRQMEKMKEDEEKNQQLEAAAKLKEEEEAKLREEEQLEAERLKAAQLEAERLKAAQLEADHRTAIQVEKQWIEEDLRERERLADLRRQQDDPRRRVDESSRPSGTSIPPSSFPPSHVTVDATSSRSSTASVRSSTSSWTSSSTRPTSTASSQASTPVRSTTTSTSSGKAKPSNWQQNATPTSGTSPYQSSPLSETEWARRQAEHAKRQQEQFRKEQERLERERHSKSAKNLSKEEIIQLFQDHDRQWARIQTLDDLGWESFPWPVFKKPMEPEELTSPAISAYVLSPHHPNDKSKAPKDRVKDHIKKWHPDRFETKLLTKVRENEKEKVQEGAGLVARNLNELLTRSNLHD